MEKSGEFNLAIKISTEGKDSTFVIFIKFLFRELMTVLKYVITKSAFFHKRIYKYKIIRFLSFSLQWFSLIMVEEKFSMKLHFPDTSDIFKFQHHNINY